MNAEIKYLEYQLDEAAADACLGRGGAQEEYEAIHEDLAKLRGKREGIRLREKNRVTGRNFMRAS